MINLRFNLQIITFWPTVHLRKLSAHFRGLQPRQQNMLTAGVLSLIIIAVSASIIVNHQASYRLTATSVKLLGQTPVKKSDIKETKTTFTYNHEEATKAEPIKKTVSAASSTDSSGKTPYQAKLPKQLNHGLTFGDAKGALSFKMTPQFTSAKGRQDGSRVVYPENGRQHVYTFKRNGVKEDIILSRAPGKTLSYSWKLELGTELSAKMLPDGSLGIYSANPFLYGDLTISDPKSQALVDNARKQGDKTHLAFVLPAPFIIDALGHKNTADVIYNLNGDTLTLKAKNLDRQHYPLSIDPTIAVTTTADFRTGTDDGNIDYATANQIKRSNVSVGSAGAFTTNTNYFAIPRRNAEMVAYNGYLYILGGYQANTDTACVNTTADFACSDIQYAAINSNGSIGNFTTSSNYFAFPRGYFAAAAYNGYLYVAGGNLTSSSTGCKNGGTSLECNDIQYAAINSNGSIGAFTTNANYFNYPRDDHSMQIQNGKLYIIGGYTGVVSTACKNTGAANTYCNDIQSADININGSVGVFSTTAYSIYPRIGHASVISNGHIYITGGAIDITSATICKNDGISDSRCNDVEYAPITTDGSIGAFTESSNYFAYPRDSHASVVKDGYLYVIGGSRLGFDTNCKPGGAGSTGKCADVQYARINADGSIGAFTTNANYIVVDRGSPASVAYNGYLYIAGGEAQNASTSCKNSGVLYECNDVQYAAINTGTPTGGTLGSFTTDTDYFASPRNYAGTVAYNGYLYIAGGSLDADSTDCKNSGFSDVCNDVQYAPINADGSIGTFITNANYFSIPRYGHATLIYDNRLYIIGGNEDPSDTACKNSGTSNQCNDVQYATINADGSVGTFTTNANYFATPRSTHAAVAYNGFLYVMGGDTSFTSTACTNGAATSACNDVQYAAINSNGSLGTFTTDPDHFTNERLVLSATVYNGFLYIVGGWQVNTATSCKNSGTSDRCNDIQYAVVNANGSINAFTLNTNYFSVPRFGHVVTANNGYMYVSGGSHNATDTACKNTGVASQFCNDVQYAIINTNGSVGTFSNTSYIAMPRVGSGIATYNGQIYIAGGSNFDANTGCANVGGVDTCNDVQYAAINSAPRQGTYERTFDIGTNAQADSLVYNGSAVCGVQISYSTAPISGVFGTTTSLGDAMPSYTYAINQPNVRYVRTAITFDDQACGTQSSITDITLNWSYVPPDAPTLNSPNNGSIVTTNLPVFQFRSPQANNDYLRYKIEVCSTSNCSSVVRTIDQTASQIGWTGQNQQTSTAYTGNAVIGSSTMASHTYQATGLSWGTQYWWRAYAIDPAWSNTFSSASAIQAFTTNGTPATPTLSAPASGATGVERLPDFRLTSTDPDNDYLRYRIEVCTTSNCSSVLRTIDQPSSQTGWKSQSTQSGTAYTSGQAAVHTYQTAALSPSTQYWWRAYAIDPAGVNVLSSASSISTFTTSAAAVPSIELRGGTDIMGGTDISP